MNKVIRKALAGVAALGIAASGFALSAATAYAADASLKNNNLDGTITIKNADGDTATHYLNGYRLASFYGVVPKDDNGSKSFQYQLDTNDDYVTAIEDAMKKVNRKVDTETKTLYQLYSTSTYFVSDGNGGSVTAAADGDVTKESNPMGWIAENIGDPKDQLTSWSNKDNSELRQFANALKAVLEDTTGTTYTPTYKDTVSGATHSGGLQSAAATNNAPNGHENTVKEGYYLLLDQFDEASTDAGETAPKDNNKKAKSSRSIPILVASTIPDGAYTTGVTEPTGGLDSTYGVGTVTLKATTPQVAKQLTDANGNAKNDPTYNIGEDVYYELTATIPDFTGYDQCTAYPNDNQSTDGSGKCRKFIITDTASKGLTVDANSVVSVKVGSTELAKDTDYTVDASTKTTYDGKEVSQSNPADATVTKIDLGKFVNNNDSTKKVADYYGQVVTVKFKAVLNNSAIISTPSDIKGNPNKVGLEYSNKSDNVSDSKKVPGGEVNVYSFKFDFVKTGMDGTTPVAGAKFYLRDGNTESANYYKKADDGKWTTTSQKSDATTFTSTLENGKAVVGGFNGLKKGDYYVQEYEAAPNYTSFGLPTFKVTIGDTVNHDNSTQPSTKTDTTWGDDEVKTVTIDAQKGSYVEQSAQNAEIKVKNAKNITELPKTGGAGLVMILAAGAMFIAAGGLFALRARRKA